MCLQHAGTGYSVTTSCNPRAPANKPWPEPLEDTLCTPSEGCACLHGVRGPLPRGRNDSPHAPILVVPGCLRGPDVPCIAAFLPSSVGTVPVWAALPALGACSIPQAPTLVSPGPRVSVCLEGGACGLPAEPADREGETRATWVCALGMVGTLPGQGTIPDVHVGSPGKWWGRVQTHELGFAVEYLDTPVMGSSLLH